MPYFICATTNSIITRITKRIIPNSRFSRYADPTLSGYVPRLPTAVALFCPVWAIQIEVPVVPTYMTRNICQFGPQVRILRCRVRVRWDSARETKLRASLIFLRFVLLVFPFRLRRPVLITFILLIFVSKT